MADVIHNLGAAVAPAAFVSACALAALGLDNQASRVALRLRETAAAMAPLPPGDPARLALSLRISILGRRHVLAARALLLAYGAMAAFVLATVLALATATVPIASALVPAAFTIGAVLLAGMAGCAAGSARLRLANGGPVPDWRALAAESAQPGDDSGARAASLPACDAG